MNWIGVDSGLYCFMPVWCCVSKFVWHMFWVSTLHSQTPFKRKGSCLELRVLTCDLSTQEAEKRTVSLRPALLQCKLIYMARTCLWEEKRSELLSLPVPKDSLDNRKSKHNEHTLWSPLGITQPTRSRKI